MNLNTITYGILLCKKCQLSKSANRKVVGDLPVSGKCEVVFIGEAPGYHEDIAGKPFVGQSGKFLRNELYEAGMKNYAILNAVKCRPPDNRRPTDDEVAACHLFLKRQIGCLRPKVIVLLGRTAFKAVMGRECNIVEQANSPPIMKYRAWVVTMPHPAALSYSRAKYEPLWRLGIKTIRRLVRK
jgi:DNA polymerase